MELHTSKIILLCLTRIVLLSLQVETLPTIAIVKKGQLFCLPRLLQSTYFVSHCQPSISNDNLLGHCSVCIPGFAHHGHRAQEGVLTDRRLGRMTGQREPEVGLV